MEEAQQLQEALPPPGDHHDLDADQQVALNARIYFTRSTQDNLDDGTKRGYERYIRHWTRWARS